MSPSATSKWTIDSEAWRAAPGPILLLAGPGTGKTHQLARRVKWLVEDQKVNPAEVTVITFTKEAAENMRRRISDEEKPDVFLSSEMRPKKILTMHSLGLQIIRTHANRLNLPDDFQVLTDGHLRQLMFRDAALLSGLGEREGADADRARQRGEALDNDGPLKKVMDEYEKILRACQAIDYDDQIYLACDILSEYADVRSTNAAGARHLLVDEYQDINSCQRKLIDLLTSENKDGLFVVGDDDQSIYQFRGGSPKYIREFHREFGEASKVLCLVESRRCPDTVLGAGINVLKAFDLNRIDKPAPTFTDRHRNGAKVVIHDMPSDDREARAIAAIAAAAIPNRDVLILIPTRRYSARIGEALRKRRVGFTQPPATDDGGMSLINLMHTWTQQPGSNSDLRLCIEAILEGGAVSIPSERARKPELVERRRQSLVELAELWRGVIANGTSLWKCLEDAAKSGHDFLSSIFGVLLKIEAIDLKDVPGFLNAVAEILRPWANRSQLIDEVRGLLTEIRAQDQQGRAGVRIMTFQAAKGLEADVVCVVGLNEGIVPRSDAGGEAIAEAARLTYVSMSRAISELHLFHARKRDASTTFLQASFALKPSRFVSAIEAVHCDRKYHPAAS